MKRAYHMPLGDPCRKCGLPARSHRVDHTPIGDPCVKCGLPWENHYKTLRRTNRERRYFLGVDGEGQGRDDHRYILLAWSNASGSRRSFIEAPPTPNGRLSTESCLDFLLTIPPMARAFAFAFQYDLTMMLRDCDEETLYLLFRPELRPSLKKYCGPKPVMWHGYRLNFVGSKFTVEKGSRRVVIWDAFRFFACRFTKALSDWKVATESELHTMSRMKDCRADFDQLNRGQILEYCFSECSKLALLMKRLVDAHEIAGLKLRSYHGAGSTASAALKRLNIDKTHRSVPEDVTEAVASAFFGGRFENRVVGEIRGPLYSRDISSAYPYRLTFLPCLECGNWERSRRRSDLERATVAIVRYELGKPPDDIVWGPFPFRNDDGSICFPAVSGGGWIWLEEYLEAERMYPHIRFREAWIYRTDCIHKPFSQIPELYLTRLRLGKESAGMVIKLGINAIYGKLAQSKGQDPPFQSWAWAGLITSGTRAQILRMIRLHKDPRNLYMIATDGIYTTENFDAPKPIETGTWTEEHKKPLGGWETKKIDHDMFAVRPGIYFPINPTEEEIAAIRARGIGRTVVLKYWPQIIEAWKSGKMSITVGNVVRFCGAKSSIGRTTMNASGNPVYTRYLADDGKPRYGRWIERKIELSFDPMPKRAGILSDHTLSIRHISKHIRSKPYDPALLSEEARRLKLYTIEMLEQPDGDYLPDWGEGDT